MKSQTSPTSSVQRAAELATYFEPVLRGYVAQVCNESGQDAVANLHDAMTYALGAEEVDGTDTNQPGAGRGKRLRPVLCLLTAEALEADLELAHPFAIAIEMMHTFCLVHDDIEDGDVMRRGRPRGWFGWSGDDLD